MDASPIADILRQAAPGAAVDVLESVDMPTIARRSRALLEVVRRAARPSACNSRFWPT